MCGLCSGNTNGSTARKTDCCMFAHAFPTSTPKPRAEGSNPSAPAKDVASGKSDKARNSKCLRLEGSNFRLGGIAPITRAVPSFRVPMRLAVLVAGQKGN